ncbi:low affinity immunoglobulin gamma Fc region receptor III-like [Geothlypis trichas]
MAGDSGMAGKVALLLWAQTLGLAGAQTTQLLVEPPWRPAVLWDRVTLTCQGSGTAGATTWYKDGQRWGQEGGNNFTVTESGTYKCERPGSGLSRPVIVSNDQVVLQVPARALLEGDTLTLRCRYRKDKLVTWVYFYHEETELRGLLNGTELSLSPLQLNHRGRYRCKVWANNRASWGWEESAPVTVTVQVAAGVGWTLFFLLLLVAVIMAWHQWHRVASRKHQERAPPESLAPPQEGEVLYTHVVSSKQGQRLPRITVPQAPRVTYAELRGPQGRPRECSDINEIVP